MFSVAMQKPGSTRESPVAGGGAGPDPGFGGPSGRHIAFDSARRGAAWSWRRPSATSPTGSSASVRWKTPPCDNVAVDALVAKVRELLAERIDLGLTFPFPVMRPAR